VLYKLNLLLEETGFHEGFLFAILLMHYNEITYFSLQYYKLL